MKNGGGTGVDNVYLKYKDKGINGSINVWLYVWKHFLKNVKKINPNLSHKRFVLFYFLNINYHSNFVQGPKQQINLSNQRMHTNKEKKTVKKPQPPQPPITNQIFEGMVFFKQRSLGSCIW